MVDKRVTMLGILAGGPAAGILLATALPPQLKSAPEPPWRTVARERALEVDSYAFVDTSYSGSGPQMPWLQWMGPPRSAPFAEDFYRAEAVPISAGEYAAVEPVSYEPEPGPSPAAREELAVVPAADEANQTAEQLQAEEPQQAEYDPADNLPAFDEATDDAASDFGG